MTKTAPTVGAVTRTSRLFTKGSVDGRSRSGRYLARVRAELRRHLGDDLTPVQAAIVERVAAMKLRLALLDERAAMGAVLSVAEERSYATMTLAVVRTLRRLGPAVVPRAPTLAEFMRDFDARKAAAEREAAAP